MAAPAKREQDLVAEAARRALDDAAGDVATAARMLETAVRANSPLHEALMEPLISGACWGAIRKQVQAQRAKVWKPTGPTKVERVGQSQVHRVVQLAAGTLLMFPLPGGKALKDATRAEISEAAGFYDRQAGDMAHKARWLRLVGQSVPDGKKVGEVLTDKRLRELQTEAQADV